MWFKVKPAELGFVDRSKRQFTYDYRVAAPPGEVFDAISDPVEFAAWFPDHRATRWLTAEPHGIGSVREVRLKTINVEERVLAWEPGRRFAFTIIRSSAPILSRMVEDFRLTGREDGSTRVQWTVAYQPRVFALPLVPVLRPVFGRMFSGACDALTARYADRLAR